MNRHTSPSTDQHQQIMLLLPWYLNKSLEKDERERVESHLRNCILCSREMVALRKLATVVKQSSDMDVAAEASLARFRKKLQTADPVRQKPVSGNNRTTVVEFEKHAHASPDLSGHSTSRYNRLLHLRGSSIKHFAIAASMLLAMIPVIMQYGRSSSATDYYTLSAAKPEAPTGTKLRIVFSKSLPDTVIDSLLENIHGKLVEGPNSVGAYTVRLADGQDSTELTTAITFLRNQQNVMLVEPVIEP